MVHHLRSCFQIQFPCSLTNSASTPTPFTLSKEAFHFISAFHYTINTTEHSTLTTIPTSIFSSASQWNSPPLAVTPMSRTSSYMVETFSDGLRTAVMCGQREPPAHSTLWSLLISVTRLCKRRPYDATRPRNKSLHCGEQYARPPSLYKGIETIGCFPPPTPMHRLGAT